MREQRRPALRAIPCETHGVRGAGDIVSERGFKTFQTILAGLSSSEK